MCEKQAANKLSTLQHLVNPISIYSVLGTHTPCLVFCYPSMGELYLQELGSGNFLCALMLVHISSKKISFLRYSTYHLKPQSICHNMCYKYLHMGKKKVMVIKNVIKNLFFLVALTLSSPLH